MSCSLWKNIRDSETKERITNKICDTPSTKDRTSPEAHKILCPSSTTDPTIPYQSHTRHHASSIGCQENQEQRLFWFDHLHRQSQGCCQVYHSPNQYSSHKRSKDHCQEIRSLFQTDRCSTKSCSQQKTIHGVLVFDRRVPIIQENLQRRLQSFGSQLTSVRLHFPTSSLKCAHFVLTSQTRNRCVHWIAAVQSGSNGPDQELAKIHSSLGTRKAFYPKSPWRQNCPKSMCHSSNHGTARSKPMPRNHSSSSRIHQSNQQAFCLGNSTSPCLFFLLRNVLTDSPIGGTHRELLL